MDKHEIENLRLSDSMMRLIRMMKETGCNQVDNKSHSQFTRGNINRTYQALVRRGLAEEHGARLTMQGVRVYNYLFKANPFGRNWLDASEAYFSKLEDDEFYYKNVKESVEEEKPSDDEDNRNCSDYFSYGAIVLIALFLIFLFVLM